MLLQIFNFFEWNFYWSFLKKRYLTLCQFEEGGEGKLGKLAPLWQTEGGFSPLALLPPSFPSPLLLYCMMHLYEQNSKTFYKCSNTVEAQKKSACVLKLASPQLNEIFYLWQLRKQLKLIYKTTKNPTWCNLLDFYFL